MTSKTIEHNYSLAKESFAAVGVDTEMALAMFETIPVSLHCWQGDDVRGFEGLEAESQNLVTGSYLGAARNGDELRADIVEALRLSPLMHKVNLHSMYAERKRPRNELEVEDFRHWIDWAKEIGIGLDFNASFFTHPRMRSGFSLASTDRETRDYWIRAGIGAREISLAIGKELGVKCYNNIWVPDGEKDQPIDRFRYRELLADSLDQIFARKYSEEEKRSTADVLEGKLFGIGTECFVVGSHDFYLAYAIKNGVGVCMDTGHYHPTESVADKISAVYPFVENLMLHLSRGVRWDSDHVLIQSDELTAICAELKRGALFGSNKLAIGLDFFDASINRVAAWAVGLRAAAKAILFALLEPTKKLMTAELAEDFTARLILSEECKHLPYHAVWDYLLALKNIPCGDGMVDRIRCYERETLSLR